LSAHTAKNSRKHVFTIPTAPKATQLCHLHVSMCIYVFIRAQHQNDITFMRTQPITRRGLRSSGILCNDRYLGLIKQSKYCLTPEDGVDMFFRNVDNTLSLYAA